MWKWKPMGPWPLRKTTRWVSKHRRTTFFTLSVKRWGRMFFPATVLFVGGNLGIGRTCIFFSSRLAEMLLHSNVGAQTKKHLYADQNEPTSVVLWIFHVASYHIMSHVAFDPNFAKATGNCIGHGLSQDPHPGRSNLWHCTWDVLGPHLQRQHDGSTRKSSQISCFYVGSLA